MVGWSPSNLLSAPKHFVFFHFRYSGEEFRTTLFYMVTNTSSNVSQTNERPLTVTLAISESWELELRVKKGIEDEIVEEQLTTGNYEMNMTTDSKGAIEVMDEDGEIIATGDVEYGECQDRFIA